MNLLPQRFLGSRRLAGGRQQSTLHLLGFLARSVDLAEGSILDCTDMQAK
ncbi:hypothetical protein H0E84_16365 [Luteimonas sp. SJ-92]|uniref:Uncharacterized protein n=1 Tax=Luteimonas salinisoli TaxID=2752307 RepID=A0A853JGH1_9GAMM|nr:hypothetical protein [Luteimonas salinisoli]NZA27955.1 hypothetical protein [Luteimonas salinisoli]